MMITFLRTALKYGKVGAGAVAQALKHLPYGS